MSESGARVEGPIKGREHGRPFGEYAGDIGDLGYVEEEYFVSGEARRFRPAGELGADGRWTVRPVDPARYRTRVLVRRPANQADFTGTVVVEWLNVSAGYDIAFLGTGGLCDGVAYVGVSAQPLGVVGFPADPKGLKIWDPRRYGSLDVPDDAVGYDIFTQVARLLRDDGSPLLGGQAAGIVIGAGVSQSGIRLLAYANGIQPLEDAFDALVPMLNAGMAGDFDPERAHPDRAAGEQGHSRSVRADVRDDLDVPVLVINSETEAAFYAPLRRRDTGRFRSWEIAGASHVPAGHMALIAALAARDGVETPKWGESASQVTWLHSYEAALQHLRSWVEDGVPAPAQPPIEIGPDGRVMKDELGNARGGVRLPPVEVPIAAYGGFNPDGVLAGTTTPLAAETLAKLYPAHEDYVAQVAAAAKAAVAAGVLLPRHADSYIREAESAPVPPPC